MDASKKGLTFNEVLNSNNFILCNDLTERIPLCRSVHPIIGSYRIKTCEDLDRLESRCWTRRSFDGYSRRDNSDRFVL